MIMRGICHGGETLYITHDSVVSTIRTLEGCESGRDVSWSFKEEDDRYIC